jgi:hypothetical protein
VYPVQPGFGGPHALGVVHPVTHGVTPINSFQMLGLPPLQLKLPVIRRLLKIRQWYQAQPRADLSTWATLTPTVLSEFKSYPNIYPTYSPTRT